MRKKPNKLVASGTRAERSIFPKDFTSYDSSSDKKIFKSKIYKFLEAKPYSNMAQIPAPQMFDWRYVRFFIGIG